MTSPVPEPGSRTRDEVRAQDESGALWLAPPLLPPWPVVWLAIEGGPPGGQADGLVRIWRLAVDDGEGEPRPETVTAGFDDPGGRRAWGRFVACAGEILERHPEARWVHCSPGESAMVRACARAYGAPAGFLERLEEALFELLSRGVRRALRLSPEACSLEQLARLAGFHWRPDRLRPSGPTGRPRRVLASADPVERAQVLRESEGAIAEDLMAMRAVWRWMLEQGPREYCG